MRHHEVDQVTFQILRYAVEEILAEMYHTIVRISGNPVLYESGDHEEAILNASGDTVLAGGGVVEWTTCLENGVKFLIENFGKDPGFNEGEQWIHNHSYGAAVHGMDVQILKPIFWEGRLVAWAVTAGHQSDIGGIDSGSFCVRATEVFQEGLLIRGLRIVEKNRVRKDVEETIRGLVRTPDVVMMGLYAAIASNNVGEARMYSMIRRYGLDTVLTFFEQIKQYSWERVRARLQRIPDGQWHVEHYIESIVPEEAYLKVVLTSIKQGDEVIFDYTGSSPQSKGSQNVARVGAMSNAHCAWLTLMCHDVPWSAGAWRPLKFILPEGTIVNPTWPAATSTNTPGGTGYIVISSAFDILSRMLLCSEEEREGAFATTNPSGGRSNVSGVDHRGRPFTLLIMDSTCGGQGAFCYRDGDSTWGNMWGPKTQIANIETNELHFPILYLFRRERLGSGGVGKYRGGDGLQYTYVPHGSGDTLAITAMGMGTEIRMGAPLAGGYPPANVQLGVIRNTNLLKKLKRGEMPRTLEEVGKSVEPLFPGQQITLDKHKGDMMICTSAGGAGYGDPLDRDPALVLKDVKDGVIPMEAAEWYGVVIDPERLEVDVRKTTEKRHQIREERLKVGRK